MSWQRIGIGALAATLIFVTASMQPAWAQIGGGGGTGGGGNTNVVGQPIAGIEVDASGVVKMNTVVDRGWVLMRRRIAEARASLPADLSRPSELRKISLNRLEAAVAARLAQGEDITDEMRYLAGLTRVKYVFCYPETGDIVLAGPAEGWMQDPVGRVRGVQTGLPIVELRDLVVALRAFPPTGQATPVISCSIDPTQEGLAKLQSFLRQLGSRAVPGQTQFIVNGMRESLGLQVITIRGVPATTHFAQILVEADYRMKLIGIGKERPRVRMASYVELASASHVSANAMQRWYFVPNYECVRASEDRLAMELVGDGVKLVGADEMVAQDGTRVAAAKGDLAGKKFVNAFTEKYPEIARVMPIYAQLRNVIDLAVAAAFIQQQDYYGRVGWTMDLFADEARFSVEKEPAAKQIPTAVAAYWKGNRLMTPIGGGVQIEAAKALQPSYMLEDENDRVLKQRASIQLDQLAEGQWWWD